MRIWVIVFVALAVPRSASAAPPSGYSCGDGGKPVIGKGCECPTGKIDARDSENTAICVAKPQTRPAQTTAIEISAAVDPNIKGAAIVLDGLPKGNAPTTLQVSAGRHLIELKKDGFAPFSQWLEVKAGQQLTLAIALLRANTPPAVKKGTVLVYADVADAEVLFDGTRTPDTTPTLITDVAEGPHVVEVRKAPALPWKQTIMVKAGEQTKIVAQLAATFPKPTKPSGPAEPAKLPAARSGSILIEADLPQAEVFVDGKLHPDRTPTLINDLPEGPHVIELRKPPAVPWKQTVYVKAGDQTKLRAELGATLPKTADELWKLGVVAFEAQRYKEAIEPWNKLVALYPTHERADDALYFVGQSYSNLKDWEKSIAAYQRLLDKFPDSFLTDDGLYFAALAAQNLKQCREARAYLSIIKSKHPKSNVLKQVTALDDQLKADYQNKAKCSA